MPMVPYSAREEREFMKEWEREWAREEKGPKRKMESTMLLNAYFIVQYIPSEDGWDKIEYKYGPYYIKEDAFVKLRSLGDTGFCVYKTTYNMELVTP